MSNMNTESSIHDLSLEYKLLSRLEEMFPKRTTHKAGEYIKTRMELILIEISLLKTKQKIQTITP